jgi:hypothetical protein
VVNLATTSAGIDVALNVKGNHNKCCLHQLQLGALVARAIFFHINRQRLLTLITLRLHVRASNQCNSVSVPVILPASRPPSVSAHENCTGEPGAAL